MAKLITRSTNGTSWTGVPNSSSFDYFLNYGDYGYLGVSGNRIFTSGDGINWQLFYYSSLGYFTRIAYNNYANLIVAIGNDEIGNAISAVYNSYTESWTENIITINDSPFNDYIKDLKCDGYTFWACSYYSYIIKSTNGVSWTSITTPGTITYLYSIASKNKPVPPIIIYY